MEQVSAERRQTPDGLELDLYTPPAAKGATPCVILIHGGPIPANLLTSPKNWELFRCYGRLLAASGLSAIMFDHQFYGPEQARLALSDIQRVVGYVHEHGQEFNIDVERLCLWAFSGGGILLSPFLRQTSATIRCLVAYYAALDASVAEFSPLAQISASAETLPAILVARAGLDTPAYNEAADRFIQQALKQNAQLDVLNHANGQHGFDVRDDNERTRDILERTVDFIRINLAGRT